MSLEEPGVWRRAPSCVCGYHPRDEELNTYAESHRRLVRSGRRFNAYCAVRAGKSPADCIQEVRLRNTVTRPAMVARPNESMFSQEFRQSSLGFSLGSARNASEVRPKGTVMKPAKARRPSPRIQVNFDDGAKWLVLAYAPAGACNAFGRLHGAKAAANNPNLHQKT